MYLRRRKSNLKRNMLCSTALLALIMGAGVVNVKLKELTNNKPLEQWALDEVTGKNEIEKKFAIEATMYQSEIEKLKQDMDIMRNDKVSRGEVLRLERLNQDKVIKAIKNNLKGVFTGKADYIFFCAKNYNVNPMLMASIIKHETGNGSSKMVTQNNNPGGITSSKGFAKYETLEAGIDAMAKLLKEEYIDKGRTSIESIQKVYCPIGASNDPNGINKYWLPMVSKNYQTMLQEAR